MRLLCARIDSIEHIDTPTMGEAFGNERSLASCIVGALLFPMDLCARIAGAQYVPKKTGFAVTDSRS